MSFLLGDKENFRSLTDDYVSIILFGKKNCKDSKYAYDIINELSESINGNRYIYIDVDENPELTVSNIIIGYPSVLIMSFGIRMKRIIGLREKSFYEQEIKKVMKSGL